ncbi:COG2426 family protein [Clostridium sp. DL1XJH146]
MHNFTYNILKVMVMSVTPLIEQRGAIPFGIIVYGINPYLVFVISFLSSLIPVPFILLLFNKIFDWMKQYRVFYSFSNFIQRKIDKNKGKMEKYEEIGLTAFIAVPLPTTGIWTGTVVAAFLKLDFKKSVLCAAIGGLISATIITMLSVMIPSFFGY